MRLSTTCTMVVMVILVAACGSGGGIPRVTQPPLGAGVSGAGEATTVQALYEAGRDVEAVGRAAGTGVRSEDVWFGAQSLLRMGQRTEAGEQFRRLRDTADSDAFRRAAEVALARLAGQPDVVQVAQAAGAQFPTDPFVQFEVGITNSLLGDQNAAAQAFDAVINASPAFAYAHYYSGLAYDRLNRADLAITRFESFIRLAPSAPERPQVESILRTARGR